MKWISAFSRREGTSRRRSVPFTRLSLLMLVLGLAGTSAVDLLAAAAPRFETPPVLKAADLLPPEMRSGPLFQVDDRVPTDGFLGHFTLRSEVGTFAVPGRELLRIRIAELHAIQQLEHMSKSQVFVEALGRSAAKPLESAQQIITHPVDTVTALPAGISRLFDRVSLGAQKISEAAADPTKNGTQRAQEAAHRVGSVTITALGFEQGRRQLAKSLGVDPYTTNPVLAQKLTDIAWVSFSGRLSVNLLITALVPASLAISGTSITRDLVYDTPSADLIVKNKQKLLALGATEAQAQALLNNHWYSLSVLTSLVIELERLSGVTGRPEVIALVATARNEEEARIFAAEAHMLAQLHTTNHPISRMTGQGTIVAFTDRGSVIVPAPVDYMAWTERVGRFAARPDLKAKQRGIWLTGKMSPSARQGFIRLGWTLNEAFLPQ